MKHKRNVRAAKSVAQQIEDLKRAAAKYGDHDGGRAKQIEKLFEKLPIKTAPTLPNKQEQKE